MRLPKSPVAKWSRHTDQPIAVSASNVCLVKTTRPPAADRGATSHVLGRFLKDEQPVIAEALDRAVEAAAAWVGAGLEATMNKYNAD